MIKEDMFEIAKKRMPNCVGGFDVFVHSTTADLAFLVQLQVDLFNEGEESDIKTKRQYVQCLRFLSQYSWQS